MDPASVHEVSRRPFVVEVALEGVFESARTAELALRPEVWQELVVVEAVEAGTAVKKGQVLLRLETRKIDEAIAEAEEGQGLLEVAAAQAAQRLKLLERTTPLDRAAAERAKRHADGDLERFLEVDRPLAEKDARVTVKTREDYLAYETEELRQLEKMYKADDLTEETEEIILRRQRDTIERLAFELEQARARSRQVLQVDLPRREVALKEAALRRTIDMADLRVSLPLGLQHQRRTAEKLERDREKAADRLAKLRRDREAMVVTAPMDGIVYYGRAHRGRWTTAAAVAPRLLPGGSLKPHEVFLTVVQPRPMFVRVSLPEKKRRDVQRGMTGRAEPAAFPDALLAVKVESVSLVPVVPEAFDCRLSVKLGPDAESVMPGMVCTVSFVPYQKERAIAVPSETVFEDELDAKKHHVLVVGDDGGHEKRAVTIGRRSEGRTEILKGLREGERILLEEPK